MLFFQSVTFTAVKRFPLFHPCCVKHDSITKASSCQQRLYLMRMLSLGIVKKQIKNVWIDIKHSWQMAVTHMRTLLCSRLMCVSRPVVINKSLFPWMENEGTIMIWQMTDRSWFLTVCFCTRQCRAENDEAVNEICDRIQKKKKKFCLKQFQRDCYIWYEFTCFDQMLHN